MRGFEARLFSQFARSSVSELFADYLPSAWK
ncbi:hypothetical protein AWB74_07906 [Caballeronia arvi]|uniref:Uncharacterized protein n=1 Tax=Caballeronia arvi TaxID=1777135 RepID=A0A158L2S8_9BURK|nr:hypothetical protein AWB74_07906 [Caballeronia arvi]